jgi:redox-sensitive bicupin YhaK (pirin superfamily)
MIEIVPAGKRFHTTIDWLDSWHSFSFGDHYDPANTHHGILLVNNDDVVAPGTGFGTHPHQNMEIVTWVLDGALEHRDSAGNHGIITPGQAQRMSAGRGIRHSEMNASPDEPVHLLQMWVLPDVNGIEPGYEQRDASTVLRVGELVPIASGSNPDAVITFHQQHATMWVARLRAGDTVTSPDAPFVHAFVARGTASLDGAAMLTGDAARLTDAGALDLTATSDAEVVVWEMSATIE